MSLRKRTGSNMRAYLIIQHLELVIIPSTTCSRIHYIFLVRYASKCKVCSKDIGPNGLVEFCWRQHIFPYSLEVARGLWCLLWLSYCDTERDWNTKPANCWKHVPKDGYPKEENHTIFLGSGLCCYFILQITVEKRLLWLFHLTSRFCPEISIDRRIMNSRHGRLETKFPKKLWSSSLFR